MDNFGVDPGPAGRCEAMGAEAQTKQVGCYGPQLLEVAFVMIAVTEAVEVKRLRENRRDLVAGDVRCESARVCPHLRIRWAEIGEVAVSEGVLRGALGVRKPQPIVVQEDGPRVYAHLPVARSRAKVAERIAAPHELGDARLELQTLVARLIRRKEDGTALQVTHLVDRIVGKEIPRVMIGDSQRQPVYPCPILYVAQYRLEPLVVEVGGKREQCSLHGEEIICSERLDQIVTFTRNARATGALRIVVSCGEIG